MMGREKSRKPARASGKRTGTADRLKGAGVPWWKKPFLWVATLLLAAVAAAVTGWLQPRITGAIDTLTETGDPISVTFSLKPSIEDVSLPISRPLTDSDLERLSAMAPDVQISWLAENGGTPIGPRTLTATLKGNRTHLVRVTDMRPVSECQTPSRGTLVLTAMGRGGVPSSTTIYLDAEDPRRGAQWYPPGADQTEPFVPGRTITLTGPEEEYVVLDLIPSRTQQCRVQVELTIMDGDKEVHQHIPNSGQSVTLMPGDESTRPEVKAQYSAVYLGAYICKRVVLAPEDYASNIVAACGPGNIRDMVGR